MNLSLLDWSIVCCLLLGLAAIALFTRKYTRSVSDFLAGNRCAGRYLLTMSEGITGLGLVGAVAAFEKFYQAGFAASWWGTMMLPIGMILALSGWVSYRYRQTRAMTMAQFFEMRYSRRFRIFSGMLGFVSGVLNYSVFPGIAARFIVHFGGLPSELTLLGVNIPTIAPIMLFMLSITLCLTLTGGLVTIMVTDFIQALLLNVVFFVVMIVLFAHFGWADISKTLASAPEGKSLIDPFDQSQISDFNFWFFVIFAFKLVYNRLGWQGSAGYNCAAKSPHEAKMAGILAEWRGGVTYLMLMLMPIAAYVLLHDPAHAPTAAAVNSTLANIAESKLRTEMTVPIALSQILPVGVVGLLCAVLISATIGTDSAYLHSWGSMFVQDIVLPIRKSPLSQKQHIRMLRGAIVGVAIFAFFFSLLFPLREYILMYMLLTGAIYLAGSGAAIVGGLYWSRGTTAGAWSAMITGCVLALGGVVIRTFWTDIPVLAAAAPQFPLNGAWIAFIASVSSLAIYVAVSLATSREAYNMDLLLHRGPYAPAADTVKTQRVEPRRRFRFGITDEFSAGDRFIYWLKIIWTTFWITTFAVGCLWAATWGVPKSAWIAWWHFSIMLGAIMGLITIVWFAIGGTNDLIALFRTLRTGKSQNPTDKTDSYEIDKLSPEEFVHADA